ncbi:MAG: hypothetical protein IPK32_19070 [Verrucomicrobiaceae bacterium]|nr:hypothetical protein [Verrucomicrobiaceae bacterium]
MASQNIRITRQAANTLHGIQRGAEAWKDACRDGSPTKAGEPPPGAAVIFNPASFLGSQNGKKKRPPGLGEKESFLFL